MQIPAGETKAIVEAVLAGEIWRNPLFYLTTAVVALLANVAASFITSYFGSRGKNLATKADFDQILEQLRRSTETSEEIRAQVQSRHEDASTLRAIIRDRLEVMMTATFDLELWLEQARSTAIHGNIMDLNSSPLNKLGALQSLYFQEILFEMTVVRQRVTEHNVWAIDVVRDTTPIAAGVSQRERMKQLLPIQTNIAGAIDQFRNKLVEIARSRGGL